MLRVPIKVKGHKEMDRTQAVFFFLTLRVIRNRSSVCDFKLSNVFIDFKPSSVGSVKLDVRTYTINTVDSINVNPFFMTGILQIRS